MKLLQRYKYESKLISLWANVEKSIYFRRISIFEHNILLCQVLDSVVNINFIDQTLYKMKISE